MSCPINMTGFGPSPIPEEAKWVQVKEIKQISGFSHGCGKCAPQQGTCKLTLNVKNGIIKEALVETIGCSGMTHSAAMAAEILPGKTLLEALNTDLVCDAINDAMKQIEVGAALEDLGKNLTSNVGTVYSRADQGTKYLNLAEGYITKEGLDKNGEIIGYEYVSIGMLLNLLKDENIKPKDAIKKATKTYGRFDEAVSVIDPRRV